MANSPLLSTIRIGPEYENKPIFKRLEKRNNRALFESGKQIVKGQIKGTDRLMSLGDDKSRLIVQLYLHKRNMGTQMRHPRLQHS